MKIEILGTGCAKCNALHDATTTVAEQIGVDCDIEKVSDLGRIASYGVMMTPALVVNGKVQASGKVPTPAELTNILQAAARE